MNQDQAIEEFLIIAEAEFRKDGFSLRIKNKTLAIFNKFFQFIRYFNKIKRKKKKWEKSLAKVLEQAVKQQGQLKRQQQLKNLRFQKKCVMLLYTRMEYGIKCCQI